MKLRVFLGVAILWATLTLPLGVLGQQNGDLVAADKLMVMAESLPEFLREFRQFPLGITTEEFLHRFPDAKLEGAVYLRKIACCPPFEEEIYQFRNGQLIAVLLSQNSDTSDTVSWITRWGDTVLKAAEVAWGKPDYTYNSTYGDSFEFGRLGWTDTTSYVELTTTMPASLGKLSKPTSEVKPFILALLPPKRITKLKTVESPLSNRLPEASIEQTISTKLQEIPAKYYGTFYVHQMVGVRGNAELVSPAKLFAKIEAKQITLADGTLLKVAKINQMTSPLLDTGRPQIFVHFEDKDLVWNIREMPDSRLAIGQIVSPSDFKKMTTTMSIVSRSE